MPNGGHKLYDREVNQIMNRTIELVQDPNLRSSDVLAKLAKEFRRHGLGLPALRGYIRRANRCLLATTDPKIAEIEVAAQRARFLAIVNQETEEFYSQRIRVNFEALLQKGLMGALAPTKSDVNHSGGVTVNSPDTDLLVDPVIRQRVLELRLEQAGPIGGTVRDPE